MGTHVGHVAEISAALRSGRGLVWVHGDDEDRLARSLEGLCEAPLARWDCLRGLAPAQGADVEAASLLAALRRLIDQPRAGLTLLLGAEPQGPTGAVPRKRMSLKLFSPQLEKRRLTPLKWLEP